MIDLSNKRCLVTGGGGFLGSYVVEKLKERCCQEIIVPRSASCDLIELTNVRKLYADHAPQIVIHLAASVGGIGANIKAPGEYFFKNMLMGLYLVDEARQHNTEKFVTISTACAYPENTPVPFCEDYMWEGFPASATAPYGIAKRTLWMMQKAYADQYDFRSIYLLPANLYGPRDNFDLEASHVVPALIRKIYEAKVNERQEVVVWGTGNATREFLYVEDCAEGIVLATERYDDIEPINLGSCRETSIKEIVELTAQSLEFKGRVVWDTSKPDGAPRRHLDTRRAEAHFGFKAVTSLEEGLRRTIRWYLEYMKARDWR